MMLQILLDVLFFASQVLQIRRRWELGCWTAAPGLWQLEVHGKREPWASRILSLKSWREAECQTFQRGQPWVFTAGRKFEKMMKSRAFLLGKPSPKPRSPLTGKSDPSQLVAFWGGWGCFAEIQMILTTIRRYFDGTIKDDSLSFACCLSQVRLGSRLCASATLQTCVGEISRWMRFKSG